MKLRSRWRSESVFLFFTSWSAESFPFSTTESASASLGKRCNLMVDAGNASAAHTDYTSPSSLMPPRWCTVWSKHDSPCPMLSEGVWPITIPLALCSHIFAHPLAKKSPRTGACLPPGGHGCSVSDFKTGSSCYRSTSSSFAALSLSSRRWWYW